MLQYQDAYDIAYDVFAKLNIPEITDEETAKMLDKKYLRDDDSAIGALVDAEMANYDTTDTVPSDIEDTRKRAIDEVFFMIDDAINDYYRGVEEYNTGLINNAYAEIIKAIRNANIEGVADVDTEYEPSDSSVGIYRETRVITVTLTNGMMITMDVTFDD